VKTLLAFAAGFITGLAIYQAPRAIAPLFQDWPATPDGWEPRYRQWNDGVMVYSGGRPDFDPDADDTPDHPDWLS
jgi:hypothetical protein